VLAEAEETELLVEEQDGIVNVEREHAMLAIAGRL
jgi:hypothetical protein